MKKIKLMDRGGKNNKDIFRQIVAYCTNPAKFKIADTHVMCCMVV